MTQAAVLVSLPRSSRRATTARWSDVGVHRLCAVLWLLNGVMLAAELILFRATGIHLVWSSAVLIFGALAATAVFWGYFAWQPGSPREWIIPEAAMAFSLLVTNALIAPPMQYPAVALQRPIIDSWLAAADVALGISVPAIVHWTSQHPMLVAVLQWSYISLVPQFMAAIVLLPFFNDRLALWEYVWHFLLCSAITVACLAMFPAVCTFTYQSFAPLLNESRFIEHFARAREGIFTTVDFNDLEGLVSCPSFHVAGAWMVTWAFRRTWLVAPLAIVNILLVASTVMLGAHYAVDLLATAAMIALSCLLFRVAGRRLLPVH